MIPVRWLARAAEARALVRLRGGAPVVAGAAWEELRGAADVRLGLRKPAQFSKLVHLYSACRIDIVLESDKVILSPRRAAPATTGAPPRGRTSPRASATPASQPAGIMTSLQAEAIPEPPQKPQPRKTAPESPLADPPQPPKDLSPASGS